jgi:hypothetical protein
LVVAAAGAVVSDLGQSHDVERVVELAVAGAREPVARTSPEDISIGATPQNEANAAAEGNA